VTPRSLLLLIAFTASTTCAAPACPPAAQVEGDEPVATAIREMLAARGVGSEIALTCPGVYAVVRETRDGLVTFVRDDSGRERAYEVRDRDTAATIVESWARHDLEDSLLLGRKRPAVTTPDATSAPAQRPISAAVFAGSGHGIEGSIWSDVSMTGCVRLGGVCAGALARASRDSGEFGDADRYDTLRSAYDILATVDGARQVGRLALGGGIGFGGGWQDSKSERRVNGIYEAEKFGGVRFEARATAGWSLARELQVQFTVTGGVSPLAHQAAIHDDGSVIAGEPRGWMRFALGMRFGGL